MKLEMSLTNLYNTWRHPPHAKRLTKLFFNFYTLFEGVIQHNYNIVPNNVILLVSLVLMYNKTLTTNCTLSLENLLLS